MQVRIVALHKIKRDTIRNSEQVTNTLFYSVMYKINTNLPTKKVTHKCQGDNIKQVEFIMQNYFLSKQSEEVRGFIFVKSAV